MDRWLVEIQPSNFEPEVLKCPKPALVTFLKKGVASGDMLLAVLKRLAQEHKVNICFFKVDVEGCADVAARYRINKIPTTLIFLRGEVVAHFFGVMSTQKIRNTVEEVIG